jgi:hypothetical protein
MKIYCIRSFIVVSIFTTSLFFSCTVSIEKKEKKLFPKEKKIVFSNMNVDENLGRVVEIKAIENYLVISERNMETQVQLIDKKTKENYLFGQTGEGPGHFLQSDNIIPINNRNIGVYDLQKGALFTFNIDSIIKLNLHCMPEVLIKEVSSHPKAICRISEDTYAIMGITNGLSRFSIINADGEIISNGGSLPAKQNENTGDITHAFAYWGRLTANEKKGKFALTTNYAGILQIYDCKMEDIQLYKEHVLFLADYEEKSNFFAVSPQTRWGYIAMDSNDKYIFALYSGKNQFEGGDFDRSNTVHVFDWDGNPVCRLLLDKTVEIICVDDDNLYGYGYDDKKEKADIMVAGIGDLCSR